ncbi:hypothetical protein [Polaribacter huanghezhanensis]|uniref:hypothetical protein n=1 Tax=Polaribacter huanghezhanensis TaxID=1354726 RepID=UPI00264A4915|nr:hypothetical protein [Polaribacter huanghezhanensis]
MIAQEPVQQKVSNKGKFYVYWGWNRGTYSNSDIRFKGENYDFTLSDVTANDRPTKFGINPYFRLDRITIPQTNYRIGYFFKENYTISIGVDHMKYVMNANQNVLINGTINTGSSYDKVYTNENIQLVENFLTFEHTDGLNYINAAVNRFDDFSYLIGLNSENFQINLTEGLGAGILFPKTNTKLLGKERHDDFHISGWGVSASVGLNITFLKHFFIQSDVKAGYINMSDIRTTKSASDTASQSFYFIENTILLGGRFRLF